MEQLHKALVHMMVKANVPFNFVEKKAVRDFLEVVSPGFPPELSLQGLASKALLPSSFPKDCVKEVHYQAVLRRDGPLWCLQEWIDVHHGG